MKAIILAGGFGTRIKHVLGSVPKPLATVNGKPVMEYMLDELAEAGISETIISVHHRKEAIMNYFGATHKGMKLRYAAEKKPLGTGGAIMNAMNNSTDDTFLVMNGDSLRSFDIKQFKATHNGRCTLLLHKAEDTLRYGRVEVSKMSVTSFREKGISGKGLISAGCYILSRKWLEDMDLPECFSIERDVFCKKAESREMGYMMDNGLFIDIGTESDLIRAQSHIATTAIKAA